MRYNNARRAAPPAPGRVYHYMSMTNRITAAALLALLLLSCGGKPVTPRETLVQRSPDGALALTFGLTEKGEPVYALSYKGQDIVLPSKMGFSLLDQGELNLGPLQ